MRQIRQNGKASDIKNAEVKRITETLKKSCDEFCIDKGVKNSMSVREKIQMEARWEGRLEGREEGMAEGMAEGMRILADLIKSGLSVDEAMKKLNSKTKKQGQHDQGQTASKA